jgi:hypothetical protein
MGKVKGVNGCVNGVNLNCHRYIKPSLLNP